MKTFVILFSFISIVYCKTLTSHSRHYSSYAGAPRCINVWDEGCVNGQLGGSGNDDDYLNGGFTPGKRCVNMWDEGCVNGQLGGSGNDDDYLNGGFTPGKRCVNMWDEGCINGQLGGSGNDDDYLNGGFNPGKRSVHMWNEGHGQIGGKVNLTGFKKSLHDLLSKLQNTRHYN